MQPVLHYLELRAFFHRHPLRTRFPVTVEKLADIWHCTPRYVKQLVRKLNELGWIEWQAGRGRGHTSAIAFLLDADDILLAEVKGKVEQGDVKGGVELMERFGANEVKGRFMKWLSDGMGFSTKKVSDRLQDTLRFPVYRSIYTLDPGMVYYAFDSHLVGQLFNTLVEYDRTARAVVPCIAHFWESNQQATEWTFHLKKGVTFHHGRELRSQDVVFSLDRLRRNPDRFRSSWMYRDIELVEAVDQKTVRIVLREPNHLFLQFLADIHASILPEEMVRKDETAFAKNPVGTGPFQLVRHDAGVCVLEAFPLHFRGRPQLDRVEVLMLPDMEPGSLREPDWNSVMPSHGNDSRVRADQEALLAEKGEWFGVEAPYCCCSLLVFNQWKSGPQNHPAFREALDHILDRRRMIADLKGDLLYPAKGFRPHPPPADCTAEPACSRSAIEALLKESGYRGERFRLTSNSYHETEAVWIAERCRMFGIDMEVHVSNDSLYMVDHLHDARLFGGVFSDDEICELELYTQPDYALPAYDSQLTETVLRTAKAVRQEPLYEERQKTLAHLEELIRQTRSVLFLAYKKNSTTYHKSIRGVTINGYGWLDFDKIWFHPQLSGRTGE